MGNREQSSQQDGFKRMLTELNREQHRRVNVHPEKVRMLRIRNT